jgi:hypothetical protein
MEEYMASLPPYNYKHEWDPEEAAKILVSCARRKWSRSSKHIDDITCCMIKLKAKHSLFRMDDEEHIN